MKSIKGMLARGRLKDSIRAQVLAIVLIPSLALLILGVGGAGYLVVQGNKSKDWAVLMQDALAPGYDYSVAVQEERRLSMLRLAGDRQNSAALEDQRQEVNHVLTALDALTPTMSDLNEDSIDAVTEAFHELFRQLPLIRQRIDTSEVSPMEVYEFYNHLVDIIAVGLQGGGDRRAPVPELAADEMTAYNLLQAGEAMSRGNALAAGGIARGGLTTAERLEYANQVGNYHVLLESLLPRLTEQDRAQYVELTESTAWKQLATMENALILGNEHLPLSVAEWQDAAVQVSTALLDFWSDYQRSMQEAAASEGENTFTQSLIAGFGVLALAIVGFLVAVRIANKLINRLRRLRAETLELADERLPRAIERLQRGEEVDLETEFTVLDRGKDEIGKVAEAFDKAQRTAVAAAINEANTREGVRAVFLNIAYRSQVLVRRQLEILDEAERKQEDPDQLELLFKIDHLATRSRRNAENLVILGGSQPGRQWRHPVPLLEVVRSAIGETEDYSRIQTGKMPVVSMLGGVVADLVHLLAELLDNATSFSPPSSQVEVRGNVVGQGVVVEVEDQGLGIPKEERDLFNESLHVSPDFDVVSLSQDARLGLFVVARLAARHGISVTLAESAYGGTRAIVLLRSNLIAPTDEQVDADSSGSTTTEIAPFTPLPRSRGNRASIEAADPSMPETSWFEPSRAVEPPAKQTLSPERPSPRRDSLPETESTGGNGTVPTSMWPVTEPTEDWVPPPQSRHAEPAVQDDRPPLPRRRRQASIAPQLATDAPDAEPIAGAAEEPSAEHARAIMTAFQSGTQRAREQQ